MICLKTSRYNPRQCPLFDIKNVQKKAITRGIYIGKNVTLLKIKILYFKNEKSK